MNTKIEQKNLNTLIDLLNHRLQSSGKAKSTDEEGNITYIDCDIYSRETLEAFITLALSEFNQTPPRFTDFNLADSKFIGTFTELLVEGATLYALSSQALLERGREFVIGDNGVSFTPPSVAEMLNTQYTTLLQHHQNKLLGIKSYFDASTYEAFKG